MSLASPLHPRTAPNGHLATLPAPVAAAIAGVTDGPIADRLGAGWLALLTGEIRLAESHLAVAVARARADRARRPLGLALAVHSQAILARDGHALAHRLATESVTLASLTADPWTRGFGLIALADAIRAAGDEPSHRLQATERYVQAVETVRAAADPWLLALSLANLAEHGWAPAAGSVPPADLMAECLALARAAGDRWLIVRALSTLATLTARGGESDRAARLTTAAASLALAAGVSPPPSPRDWSPSAATPRLAVTPWPGGLPRPPHAAASACLGPTLRARAFGTGEIAIDGLPIAASAWTYTKPRELLYFLLDHPGAPKNEIGAALWPHASPAQIRGGFHVALHHLRRILGDSAWVVYTGDGYRLRDDAVIWYDVAVVAFHLDAAHSARTPADAIAHLDASLAPGLLGDDYLADLPAPWAIPRRMTLLRQRREALETLADLLLAAGRDDDAQRVARRLELEGSGPRRTARGSVRLARRPSESAPSASPPTRIPAIPSLSQISPDHTLPASSRPTPASTLWRRRGTA